MVDTITDSDGDRIEVEALGQQVYLTQTSHGFTCCVRLDAAGRDRFAKAWAEAERRAEAHAEAEHAYAKAVDRAAMPGQVTVGAFPCCKCCAADNAENGTSCRPPCHLTRCGNGCDDEAEEVSI